MAGLENEHCELEAVDDDRELTYGRPVKLLVAAGWAACVGFLVAAAIAPPNDRATALTASLVFLAAALVMHVEVFRVRVRYGAAGIATRSPWRRPRRIPWASVTRVRYSVVLQWYVIETVGHGQVRLHRYLDGVGPLLAELERRGVSVEWQPGTRGRIAS